MYIARQLHSKFSSPAVAGHPCSARPAWRMAGSAGAAVFAGISIKSAAAAAAGAGHLAIFIVAASACCISAGCPFDLNFSSLWWRAVGASAQFARAMAGLTVQPPWRASASTAAAAAGTAAAAAAEHVAIFIVAASACCISARSQFHLLRRVSQIGGSKVVR